MEKRRRHSFLTPPNVATAAMATFLPCAAVAFTSQFWFAPPDWARTLALATLVATLVGSYALLARLLYLNKRGKSDAKSYGRGFAVLLACGAMLTVLLACVFGLVAVLLAALLPTLAQPALLLVIDLVISLLSVLVLPVPLQVFLTYGLTGKTIKKSLQTAFSPGRRQYAFTTCVLLAAYGLGQAVFYISSIFPLGLAGAVFNAVATTAVGTAAICLLVSRTLAILPTE